MARANTKGTQITFAVFRSYTGQLRSVDCDANIMPGFANTGNTVTMEEGLVDMSMEGEEAELTFPPSPPMSPQPQVREKVFVLTCKCFCLLDTALS